MALAAHPPSYHPWKVFGNKENESKRREKRENVRPEKFQFLEKGKNRNFGYKIVISVKIL